MTPPCTVSDQLINHFFQEWATLYPVVHRPTILKAYQQYLDNTDPLKVDVHVMAQLNLIFGIAALSSNVHPRFPHNSSSDMLTSQQPKTNYDPACFEANWTALFENFSSEATIAGLQCFILAQIYYMTKREYRTLLRYRALAVDICHQLGLYENETSSAFNPLEGETRKRVFWCQYVLDR